MIEFFNENKLNLPKQPIGQLILDIHEILNAKELEKSYLTIGHTEFQHTIMIENGKIEHIKRTNNHRTSYPKMDTI